MAKTKTKTQTWIALLRGINVGGHNKLPMAELRELLGELGLSEVQTYIASGNIVFGAARSANRGKLSKKISTAITDRFDLGVPVVMRTPEELAAAVAGNPFSTDDHKMLHLAFLSERPKDAAAATLEADRFAPDQFELRGAEIYLYYPNGAGRSKMSIDYFERRLAVTPTARNWRTVLKLVAMSEAAS